MRVTLETDQLAVFDDVLVPDAFAALWQHVQRLAYAPVDIGAPQSPWLLTDGRPLQGPGAVAWVDTAAADASGDRHARYPTDTPLDALLERLVNDHARFARWVGPAVAEWAVVTAVPWLYPAGSALAWHTDSAMYAGAFTYYVHPAWDPHWGGELVLADPGARREREVELDADGRPANGASERFGRQEIAARVAAVGVGHYVVPTPNRLVVVAGGHPHKIARVDATAGGHVRASIAGFFVRGRGIAEVLSARGGRAR